MNITLLEQCDRVDVHLGDVRIGIVQFVPHLDGEGTVYDAVCLIDQECKTCFTTETAALQWLRDRIEGMLGAMIWPDDDTKDECTELKQLLDAEITIIKKHLDRHKWFQHISDEQLATIDFINRYVWLMKELYCLHACRRREKCMHALKLKQGAIEKSPGDPI
jgi:hypothetical protein